MNKRFDLGVVATGELDAEVCCAFQVANSVFGGINVARGAFIIELGDDVGDGGKVWTSLAVKPVEGTDIFLQCFVKMLSFIGGHIDVWDIIDWVTTAVGCGFRCGSRLIELSLLNEFTSIDFLAHVDGNVIFFIFVALKVNA